MAEVTNWICWNKLYSVSRWCFILAKTFWNKKKTVGGFCSSLLSLPYRYSKWRIAEMTFCFYRFRNIIIAVMIVGFPREDKFVCLSEQNKGIRTKETQKIEEWHERFNFPSQSSSLKILTLYTFASCLHGTVLNIEHL